MISVSLNWETVNDERINRDDTGFMCVLAANLCHSPKDCIFHSDRGSRYCDYD